MANELSNIQSTLGKLQASMDKEAAEIKKQKAELQKLRSEVYDMFARTKYIRDPRKLVLSAPEIIIGNVDAEGNLIESETPSVVILRSGDVKLHATSDMNNNGTIECKASTIKNIAVDPGVDGMEEVVMDKSVIINQAKSIHIESENDKDCFVNNPDPKDPGVTILSDTTLDIQSVVSNETRTKAITDTKTALMAKKMELTTKSMTQKTELTVNITALQVLVNTPREPWSSSVIGLRTTPEALWTLTDKTESMSLKVYKQITEYTATLSELAEVTRKLNALDKLNTATSSKAGTYKTASTDAVLNIKAENINLLSMDGDGNVRDNDTAGMHIQAPHIRVETTDAQGALAKDSNIDINTKTFTLSTANAKYSDGDKHQAGDMPAEGDVNIFSKNVLIEGVDNKLNGGKQEEDKLTAGSTIKVRAEIVSVEATDKDGKATGSVKVNAKDLRLRSMDVDPKSGDEKAQAAGGQMMMLAEKMFLGSNKQGTKLVQVAAEKVGIIGKNTAEVQQDGKAVVTLSGGSMTAGGSAVSLKGNTTVEGNADIKGEAKAPKVSADQVEAKSAFKSPNINDTMGAGVPGAAGKPSASMTEEDAK